MRMAMTRKILLILVAVIIIVFAVIALTDNTLFLNEKSIVLVGYSKYSQKWIDVKEGALSAAQKQGINITAVACDSIHAVSDQIDLIEQAIDEKPDTIIIMPTDLYQLSSIIEKVMYNNIDLIIIDNYQNSEEFSFPRIGIDVSVLSDDLADAISKSKDGDIKVGCMFSYDDNGKSANIYNEFVKSVRNFDNITIVEETVSATDENVAGAATEVMINTYDLDYIVCFEETITKGASDYLHKQIENTDRSLALSPKIVGIGSVDGCIRYLEDGIISLLVLQSYYNMGYLAIPNYEETYPSNVYTAYLIIKKEDLMNEDFQKIIFRID